MAFEYRSRGKVFVMATAKEALVEKGFLGIAVIALAGAVVYVGQKWESSMHEWRSSEKEASDRYHTVLQSVIATGAESNRLRQEQILLLQATREQTQELQKFLHITSEEFKRNDQLILNGLEKIKAK